MQEWKISMQRLIDLMESNPDGSLTLSEISAQIGYSPYYCSELFHQAAKMTIREYRAKRRLAMAAVALRDTDVPVIDIALEYGYADQSTFTRAFKNTFGCAPLAYRKKPRPLPLLCKKMLLEPFQDSMGGFYMSNITKPYVRVEYIPAHNYLGVYRESQTKEDRIWPGHDCDLACGIIASFRDADLDRIVTRFTAGKKSLLGFSSRTFRKTNKCFFDSQKGIAATPFPSACRFRG